MNQLAGSRVVVTGGCGFIGSHLVRRLDASGPERIFVIDDLSSGNERALEGCSNRVEFVQEDLSRASSEVDRVLKESDYLFHLAAVKHHQALKGAGQALQANVMGTAELLSKARHSIRKVVYSSSLYVYGRWSEPPMSETDLPEPDTVYGTSKLAGEHLLRWACKQAGTPHVALRYFFTYGPGQYPGQGYPSVIYKNFNRMLRGESPVVVGDGRQVLDYVYVDDLIEATLRAMEADCGPEVLNVGSGVPTTIEELTKLMIEIGSGKAEVHAPPDATQGTFRVANIEKIRRLLGFEPTVSLTEGLTRTYAWLSDRS